MTTALASNLVAVTDPSAPCGAIVYWRLSGVVSLEALAQAWAAEGLDADALPSAPSNRVALRRTAKKVAAPGEMVTGVRRDGALAVGTLVAEKPEAEGTETDDLAVKVRGAVRLAEDGSLLVRGGIDPTMAGVAFEDAKAALTADDVSAWLSKMIRSVDAVGLRDTGGVYFVPRYALPKWEAMTRALRACSAHAIASIPAMTSAEATAAFMDAMKAAAERTAAELSADVAALAAGQATYGVRALRTKVRRAEEVEAQITRYEDALGGKLEDVRAAVMAVRAQLTVAMLSADAVDAKGAE